MRCLTDYHWRCSILKHFPYAVWIFHPYKRTWMAGREHSHDGVRSTYVCLFLCFTGVSRQNTQGGGICFPFFSMRLAKIKTPDGFSKLTRLRFCFRSKKKLMINKNRFLELRFVLSSFLGYLAEIKTPPPGGFVGKPLYFNNQ